MIPLCLCLSLSLLKLLHCAAGNAMYFSDKKTNIVINKLRHDFLIREKCPNTELFLVRIFLYSDCIPVFLYSGQVQENAVQK